MSYLQNVFKKFGSPSTEEAGLQDKSRKNNDLGDFGERLAARHLEAMGFCIIGRNIRYKVGEIDILAERKGELHFIEVKTRTSNSFGDPMESVTEAKKKRLRKAAQMYLLKARNNFKSGDIPLCYFGVIGIDFTRGEPQVECLLDAFE